MLQRVMIDGINLPRLYIASNWQDAVYAKENGIPFIRWSRSQEELISMLLRPTLERMFPHIKWSEVLGKRRSFRTKVNIVKPVDDIDYDVTETSVDDWTPAESDEEYEHDLPVDDDGILFEEADIAESPRYFQNQQNKMTKVHTIDISEYIGDMSSYVNIEILQRLRLMPAFIGNILDCVKLNVGNGFYWQEGYNKKRGLPVGRYDASRQLPNLVILDVSGSIPRGISATMISLIDTLRTQLTADLIITASISRFYKMGEELPEPQLIRSLFGLNNESYDFLRIMHKYICGKHYGHVFSFGDNDTPRYYGEGSFLAGTKVEYVHHYHTGAGASWSDEVTGYGKWCNMLADKPKTEFNTEWCKVIY